MRRDTQKLSNWLRSPLARQLPVGMVVPTALGNRLPTDQPPPSPEELLRLRLAVEASGEVIFTTDASGTITYVNPEFVRVYGYRPSEVIGRTTPRLLKSGSMTAEEYAVFWRELLANHVVKREFVNRTKSGTLVQVEGSANPIFRHDELVGFLAVQRDVTGRKALWLEDLVQIVADLLEIPRANAPAEFLVHAGENAAAGKLPRSAK